MIWSKPKQYKKGYSEKSVGTLVEKVDRDSNTRFKTVLIELLVS